MNFKITFVFTWLLLFAPHIYGQNKDINFLAAIEEKDGVNFLKSILEDGTTYNITTLQKPYPAIQVIWPYIYLFNIASKKLSVFSMQGAALLNQVDCDKFSANKNGLIIIDSKNKAQIYTIHQTALKLSGEPIDDVTNSKISDVVLLVYKDQNKSIENFRLSTSRATYFSLPTFGWSQQNNIVSCTFNNNFLISKDNQAFTKVINNQGNVVFEGRGNFKQMILSNNHFIVFYGNGKIEAYNAFDKQNILSLAKVYSMQSTFAFTTFRWEQEVTVLNEKGEIFPVKIPLNNQFVQGDNFLATEKDGLLSILNSTGELISEKTNTTPVSLKFFSDFLCIDNNTEEVRCHYAADKNFNYYHISNFDSKKILGWQNVGMVSLDNNENKLKIYLNNSKNYQFNNIKSFYLPLSADINERSATNF